VRLAGSIIGKVLHLHYGFSKFKTNRGMCGGGGGGGDDVVCLPRLATGKLHVGDKYVIMVSFPVIKGD